MNKLEQICYQAGVLSGIGMMDESADQKTRLLYRQEMQTILQSQQITYLLSEVFGSRKNEKFLEKLSIYYPLTDLSAMGSPKSNVKQQETVSEVLSHSAGCLQELYQNREEGQGMDRDALVRWSIRLNLFFRSHGILNNYYIPFAKHAIQLEEDWKLEEEVHERSGELFWKEFCLTVVEKAFFRTTKTVCAGLTLRRQCEMMIAGNKQETQLRELIYYMERKPVFDIQEVAGELEVVYNTAAKLIKILVEYELVSEISQKQRYRIYCYEKYLREYGGVD